MSKFSLSTIKKVPSVIKLLITGIKVVRDPNRLEDVLEVGNQLGNSGGESKVV